MSDEPTEGQFRELAEVRPVTLPVINAYDRESGWLTPTNRPIPLDGFEEPDWKTLDKPTPKIYRRVARKDNGEIIYRYVPITFIQKRLNEVFHHRWRTELIRDEWGKPETRLDKGNKPFTATPYTVYLQLVAPGMYGPALGVGTAYMYSNNPQESKAKTVNSALTSALKSAAKQLGIGRDVEEDDPEVAKEIGSKQTTIEMLYNKLVERGQAEAARAAVRKLEPDALMDSGALMVNAISTEHLDEVQRELTLLSTKPVKAV